MPTSPTWVGTPNVHGRWRLIGSVPLHARCYGRRRIGCRTAVNVPGVRLLLDREPEEVIRTHVEGQGQPCHMLPPQPLEHARFDARNRATVISCCSIDV
jgi:hypothetical protein